MHRVREKCVKLAEHKHFLSAMYMRDAASFLFMEHENKKTAWLNVQFSQS